MDIKSTPTTKREERERQDLLCARARASYDRTARTSRVDKAGQSLRRFLAQQVKSCVCCKCVRRRAQIAFDAGVPADLEGCHTLMVDGYVVDGLVPVDIVKKLLTERPAITGITLAGMPAGAPGMGGSKAGPFTVYAFTKDGKAPTVYATE